MKYALRMKCAAAHGANFTSQRSYFMSEGHFILPQQYFIENRSDYMRENKLQICLWTWQ